MVFFNCPTTGALEFLGTVTTIEDYRDNYWGHNETETFVRYRTGQVDNLGVHTDSVMLAYGLYTIVCPD